MGAYVWKKNFDGTIELIEHVGAKWVWGEWKGTADCRIPSIPLEKMFNMTGINDVKRCSSKINSASPFK